MAESHQYLPTVQEIAVCELRKELKNTFTTASKGELRVPFDLPIDIAQWMLTYDENELRQMPSGYDIRALRCYNIRSLKAGTKGSSEFHRIRKEAISVLSGKVTFFCEDVFGGTRSIALEQYQTLLLPPFIWHTYAVDSPAELLILANTHFNPEVPEGNDTFYDRSAFESLKQQL